MKMIPAEVASWDGYKLYVWIPGYTDGASSPIRAGICHPLGDRPKRNDFRILKGDAVWIEFNDGDLSSPIVMGFRDKDTGDSTGTRRFEHDNFEVNADDSLNLNTKSMNFTADTWNVEARSSTTVKTPVYTIDGDLIVTGSIKATGGISARGDIHSDGNITAAGSITDSDGDGGA